MPATIHLRNPSSSSGRRFSRSEYLPKYSSEKKIRRHDSSFSLLKLPLKLPRWFQLRFGKKRGSFLVFLAYVALIFIIFAFAQRFGSRRRSWPGSTTSPTLVYRREDLQRIWEWEIASGHHPSTRPVPGQLGFAAPENPALDNGIGPRRTYRVHSSQPPNVAYPPRPVPGSIADLDRIMPHCDFSENKYVRDCLEVLRTGGGLDNGKRVRRVIPKDWQYIYTEDPFTTNSTHSAPLPVKGQKGGIVRGEHEAEATFTKSRRAPWEPSPIELPPVKYPAHRPTTSCDPEEPRIFHMFWTGDFTDKPYIALLSFLYTQNLGLDKDTPSDSPCTPKLWLWINPGFVVTQHYPEVSIQMFESIKSSPWATPFLHPRFKHLIEFKLWNTTEQLEATPELKDDWRSLSTLFNSGNDIIRMPTLPKSWPSNIPPPTGQKDSGGEYEGERETDKISVVLSDMARFLLCHRFGGVYLDADTLFLRDWEELWNWKGAFAYRWSWHPAYNTAVLRMHKGSALGTFLLRTSLKNDFDFHPMTITKYLEEAKMEELLYRLPDALFDSAWLNMEGYQRDRPAQPPYSRFAEFFDTAAVDSAAPAVVGFEGFFKGAFSYHFHNSWAMLADPGRNFPDLGSRFTRPSSTSPSKEGITSSPKDPKEEEDRRDLSWSTVLKRSFEAYLRGEAPNMYGEWLTW